MQGRPTRAECRVPRSPCAPWAATMKGTHRGIQTWPVQQHGFRSDCHTYMARGSQTADPAFLNGAQWGIYSTGNCTVLAQAHRVTPHPIGRPPPPQCLLGQRLNPQRQSKTFQSYYSRSLQQTQYAQVRALPISARLQQRKAFGGRSGSLFVQRSTRSAGFCASFRWGVQLEVTPSRPS